MTVDADGDDLIREDERWRDDRAMNADRRDGRGAPDADILFSAAEGTSVDQRLGRRDCSD